MALLKRCHKQDPGAPVLHSAIGRALIEELLEANRDRVAAAIHWLYGSFDAAILNDYVLWGDECRRQRRIELARENYSKALRLDPKNKEASERLRALKNRQQK